MSNKKNYPLHPGQTHIEPYYTQVPTEEYEANMRELKQLREITAGSRTTIDDIAEIKTLTSEVKAIREMNARAQARIIELERMDTEHTIQIAKMNGYISTLEENQRWRKCSDGFPAIGISVLISDGFVRNVAALMHDYTWNVDEAFYDVDDYKFWMPLPSAPKEVK